MKAWFSRIVTLTLSPSLDRVLRLKQDDADDWRVECVTEVAGGKGNNVARVLVQLGAQPLTLTVAGGWNAHRLQELLARDGVDHVRILPAPHAVRFHTTVLRPAQAPLFLHETTSSGLPDLFGQVVRVLEEVSRPGDLVLLTGSLPTDTPSTLYKDLIDHFPGLPFAVDTAGPALTAALDARPFLIKVNEAELRTAVSQGELNTALAYAATRTIWGAIVTRGSRGTWAQVGNRHYRVDPIRVPSVSPLGAGDAYLAGLVDGLLRHPADVVRVLQWAEAVAADSVRQPEAGRVDPDPSWRTFASEGVRVHVRG